MKFFRIYRKADQGMEEAIFVPEGFAWLAAFFAPLWAVYHRLWALLGAALLVEITLRLWQQHPEGAPAWVPVLAFGWAVLVGLFAHDWRSATLEKKGYALVDVVAARNMAAAQQRYFDRQWV
jgi:hypothetical protein